MKLVYLVGILAGSVLTSNYAFSLPSSSACDPNDPTCTNPVITCAADGQTITSAGCCSGLTPYLSGTGAPICKKPDPCGIEGQSPGNSGCCSSLVITGGICKKPVIPKDKPKIAIACIRDDGTIANTDGKEVCKAALPKCADIRALIIKNTKDYLSMKIWGYYNGLDIDPNSAYQDPVKKDINKLTGAPISSGICSVVGQKVQYTGQNDFEIKSQSLPVPRPGQETRSCGKQPEGWWSGGKMMMRFNAANGESWNSYMMGVYPWIIRRKASDVFTELRDDLSNYADVLSSSDISDASRDDLIDTQDKITESYKLIGDDFGDMCSTKDNIIADCESGKVKVTDIAPNSVCIMSKAYSIYQKGTAPNLLITEIMSRAQKMYDSEITVMFDPSKTSSEFAKLNQECSIGVSYYGGFVGTSVGQTSGPSGASSTASCAFGGTNIESGINGLVNYNYYTYEDGATHESGEDGYGCGAFSFDCWMDRAGTMTSWYHLSNGSIEKHWSLANNVSRGRVLQLAKNSSDLSVFNGFPGMIEYIIRHKVCGQNKKEDASVCDSVGITANLGAAPPATSTSTSTTTNNGSSNYNTPASPSHSGAPQL